MYILYKINSFLSLLKSKIIESNNFVVCLYYIELLDEQTALSIIFLNLLLGERKSYNLLDFFLNKLDG